MKNKKIIFRIDEKMDKFLGDFALANGMTKSELVRNIVIYFLMQYFLNFYGKPIRLKEMFNFEIPRMREQLLSEFKKNIKRRKIKN